MQHQQNHTSLQGTQPFVSFIITYYDLPVQMLCECIDSILALSLRPDEREIIVIDDGSDVSPMNGLMQYGDEIIYVRQKNAGVSVARNMGLQIAKGKYTQFIDSDDAIISVVYEHCLDMIRQQPDIDIVMFDFSQSRQTQQTSFNDTPLTTGSEYMHNHNIRGAIWCCMFRSAIRGKLEFTPGIQYGEDEEFTPQLLLRAEVACATDAKAYYYRKHSASAVNRQDDYSKQKRLDNTIEVIRHLQQLCDRVSHKDRLALQRRVAQLTMDYIYNTIMMKRSRHALDECLSKLHAEGLFPLPDRDYSKKYLWFRRMTNSAFGRALLLHSLPLLKKER